MADAAISFLLEKLSQLRKPDSILGVKDDLRYFCDQLKLMRALLKDCEGVPQESEIAKVFLKDIRDLVLEAEDVIDTYLVSTSEDNRRDGLPTFFQFGIPRMKRDDAKKIRDITERMYTIYSMKYEFGIALNTASEASSVERRRLSWKKAGDNEQMDVVGFKAEANMLMEQLIGRQPELAIISIVGMGGLGKTTLAHKIYNHPLIKNGFQHRAWVNVSQEYKPIQLLLSITKQFTTITEAVEKIDDEQELGMVLQKHLTDTKYLIVLDNVWIPQVWQDLNSFFPNQGNGSRVMITTRSNEVAMQANTPHYLRFLDKEESWELFRNKALIQGENCPPECEEEGRQMAEGCGGLPLAIIVLGGLLSKNKPNLHEWREVSKGVSTFLDNCMDQCEKILALSYDDLPDYLKHCFLYFGMFPEDHEIPARQLIQLWIAEGFIAENDGETMEETAETYLEKLVDRSLIQVARRRLDYGVKTCRIHDCLRDLCISKSREKGYFQFQGSVNSPSVDSPRHLAGNYTTLMEIICEPYAKGILSFHCFTQRSDMLESEALSYSLNFIYKRVPLLRVLRMEHSSPDASTLCSETGNMIYLRYLRMSSKNDLIKISPSIYNARNLQTLDIRSRKFFDAPDGIWKMKKLRHVHFHGWTRLPQPSPDDSSLEFLQTLSTICSSSCSSQVFSKLPNLLKLGVCGNLKSHSEALFNNLLILEHLRTLKLVRTTLSSKSQMIRIPSGLPSSLTKFTLRDTALMEDPMPVLGNLPKLQILKLVGDTYDGRKMVCSAQGFPQLQLLQIVRSKVIHDLVINEGAMPNLNQLVVRNCPSFNLDKAVAQLTAQQHQDLFVEHA